VVSEEKIFNFFGGQNQLNYHIFVKKHQNASCFSNIRTICHTLTRLHVYHTDYIKFMFDITINTGLVIVKSVKKKHKCICSTKIYIREPDQK
jgi:hypothetical protein